MSENNLTRLNEELEKVLTAIKTQESLRGSMPEDILEKILSGLHTERDNLVNKIAALKGSVAVAGVERAISIKSGDVNARDIYARDVVAGMKIVHVEKKYGEDKNGIEPGRLRERYLKRVINDTGILTLQGIDPKAASCESESCLNLDAVYTALLTRRTEHEKGDPEGLERDRETVHLSALELLDRYPHMALLGDPGSGKTTFVNFVAFCLSGENLGRKDAGIKLLTSPLPDDEGKDREERQPWRHGPLIPVRIILRDFAARGFPKQGGCAADLWEFTEDELRRIDLGAFAGPLREELQNKGGLILLDGLDEVPEAENRRAQIKAVVEDFIKTYTKCRILITSRTYAYQRQEWRIPDLYETELIPFSKGQIIRFIERWYAHIAVLRNMDRQNAQGNAELLKRAVFSNRRIYELAERPLLLTLMASLHAWRGGSLPEKREELYSDAVDLLLDWWESRKVRKDSDGKVISTEPGIAEFLKTEREKVRAKLNELAYEAHSAQPELQGTADISEKDLVYGLLDLSSERHATDLRTLIRYLEQRAGLLIQRGEKIYTFPHRTFQEYLAACYLTDSDYPYQVADLARETHDRWREVALLAGAKAARGSAAGIWLLADALSFKDSGSENVTLPDYRGALLAGQALAETADLKNISDRNKATFDRVRQWLMTIVEGDRLPAVERAAAGRHLAVLGDLRKEVMTVKHMQLCLVPAGSFYMGDGDEKHLNEYLSYDYWMSRHPVTNVQYAEFMKAGGYDEERYWSEAKKEGFWKAGGFKGIWDNEFRNKPDDYGLPFNLPNHPVVGVTWYEALAFTRWLTEVWQKQGFIDKSRHVRLPSEAEWEKAARGGLEILPSPVIVCASEEMWGKSAERVANPIPDRQYPWGNEADRETANYNDTGIGTTSAAGCFSSGSTPYGCLDMAGNVWEWTRSINTDYPYDPDDGREDESVDNKIKRVLRGGAFYYYAGSVRCAARRRLSPYYRGFNFGFRVVCAPN